MPIHRVFVPKQAVGASLIYFDLWVPTTSSKRFELLQCLPVVSGAVAVVGTVGVDLLLTRTTAIGTGGTATTFNGAALDAMTIAAHDGTEPLITTDISGRLTPAGGATGGAVLAWRSYFTEETNVSTYILQPDLARADYSDVPPIAIPGGTGIRVIQGAVASVGNIGFDLILRTTNK
jgi:hypothetical protein